jgi:hypothetical protein
MFCSEQGLLNKYQNIVKPIHTTVSNPIDILSCIIIVIRGVNMAADSIHSNSHSATSAVPKSWVNHIVVN